MKTDTAANEQLYGPGATALSILEGQGAAHLPPQVCPVASECIWLSRHYSSRNAVVGLQASHALSLTLLLPGCAAGLQYILYISFGE